jgi:aminopeptidase
MDSRYQKLAETLVEYSIEVEPGEKVLVEATEIPREFTTTLIRTIHEAGGMPVVLLKDLRIQRELLRCASEAQMELVGRAETAYIEGVQGYIGARGSSNVSELGDVPADRMKIYESHVWKPVHIDRRVPNTKWVVLRWPSGSMAQLSQMSTERFEDFYFDVCTMDYARMSKAMEPLQALMETTDRVRLVAPDTDLTFSIKGIPAILCDGHRNIPDGEVYTAPVRESVNGTIRYNVPSLYRGVTHEGIRLRFEKGRIVEGSSSATDHLTQVLDADEGARYIGEFAIGFNPFITCPMKDILFDEKIAGSIHLTPGNAYKEANNGNQSQIHWDLVLMMDPASGGGEIYFDDRLIRKDGRFVIDELEGLNPERLK